MTHAGYIDPGKHQSAFAGFRGGSLIGVAFVTPESLRHLEPGDLVSAMIENPRITKQTVGKRPNDQMDLAVTVGDLAGVIRARCGIESRLVPPATWKGQVKKPVHHSRIWSVLTPDERERFADATAYTVDEIGAKIEHACYLLAQHGRVMAYSWAAHNLLDAVSLGLWDLGRTGRAGARR